MAKIPAKFLLDDEELNPTRSGVRISSSPEKTQGTAPQHTVRVKRRRTTIEDLLSDPNRLNNFLEYLKVGGSLSSASAAARINPDIASKWIRRGATAKRGPYRHFFREVQSALGEATVVAEASVRTQNPLVWLERGPGKFIAPEWAESKMDEEVELARLNAEAAKEGNTLGISKEALIASMKELRKAGVDLNEMFDNDSNQLTILSTPVPAVPGLPAPPTDTATPSPNNTHPSSPEKTQDQEPDPGESLGDFNYDEDEEDFDGADTSGTNYAEDGMWKSANYSLPSALNGQTDPAKPEHYLHNPPIVPPQGGPRAPGKDNQTAEIARASRRRPAFPATPDLAASLASDGRIVTPGSPEANSTLQSLRAALQRPAIQPPQPTQVAKASKPPPVTKIPKPASKPARPITKPTKPVPKSHPKTTVKSSPKKGKHK